MAQQMMFGLVASTEPQRRPEDPARQALAERSEKSRHRFRIAKEVQVALSAEVIDPEEHRKASQVKDRQCLQCRRQFRSEHFGHRVCCDCKELDGWKSGVSEFSVSDAAF